MANGSLEFNWDAYKESLNQLAYDVAKKNRKIRPLLTLYGEQGKWARNIIQNKVISQPSLAISIEEQNLTPITLSYTVPLPENFFSNPIEALGNFVTIAARKIANAEDAVILLGKNAKERLSLYGVNASYLEKQIGLLDTALELPPNQSVSESVREGMSELLRNGCVGDYAVVVSDALDKQARTRNQVTHTTELEEMRNLVTEERFILSSALEGRTGVMMSLSDNGIKLAVPVDISVQFVSLQLVEGTIQAILRVVEQIRLVIDIPEAIVPLRPINDNPPVK
ncbi:encapsulin [Nitrosomonas sp. Nm166]|uniref:encapsulin n=1 Tax=Nitrosomonas sp. Nm166 TaxID=1881054 RepID=UPI0008E941D0|nr:family 1 encapsulin nanocompartment shell protein [Nitrosomonas sp. Nm166]SFE80945.1 Encapsulating protein for peroxidase [Nitrosomonas sp. Nm166]